MRTGILTSQTEVNFVKDPASSIKIKASAKKCVSISLPLPVSVSRETLTRSGASPPSLVFRQAPAQRHPRAQLQV